MHEPLRNKPRALERTTETTMGIISRTNLSLRWDLSLATIDAWKAQGVIHPTTLPGCYYSLEEVQKLESVSNSKNPKSLHERALEKKCEELEHEVVRLSRLLSEFAGRIISEVGLKAL